jgi:hypothetical protein
LALPNGFHYTIVAVAGVTLLESGEPTPDRTDGSASFVRPGGDGALLVTNHEVASLPGPLFIGGVPLLEGLVYDPGSQGGTTTIEVDAQGNRVREYVSLAGTSTNCAGGVTPWNTWLTCEEVFSGPAANNTLTKPHGFVFEVDPYDMEANRDPQPIQALGRFAHEAVAVDPDTGRIYETEDANNPHGLFYRWTPPGAAMPLGKGSLKALGPTDGTFEAMRARNASGAVVGNLCVATEPGTTYAVEWVNVLNRAGAPGAQVRSQFNAAPSATNPARESPAAASSKAPGGQTEACTSWLPSRAPATAALSRTTGRSGSTTRWPARSRFGCASPIPPPTRTAMRTVRTTSRCRRTAAR